jgi:hypothetical protein
MPAVNAFFLGYRHISVMISGNNADPVTGAELLKPSLRLQKLCFKSNINQITGNSDVIGPDIFYVCDHKVNYVSAVHCLAIMTP